MATDPYAAPKARVDDLQAAADEGEFIPDGRAVPAGNGWQWIVSGWDLFKRQPGTWILIVVVFFVVAIVISLIPIIGGLASNVIGPVFAGGILLGCRELDRGDAIEVGHLFAGFRDHFGKLALLGVAYLVAVIIIMLIGFAVAGVGFGAAFGGMTGNDPTRATVGGMAVLTAALIVLALIVPVAMAMWFAAALIVFQDYGIVDALGTSFRGCLKNIVPFLIYGVILFGFAIVASIPFALGWLALGPTLAASVYTGYRDIYYA
jgi:uncharacterized membrane protein